MGRILGLQDVEAAIRGGSVFAAGGGGWVDHGRMLGAAAVTIGQPELVSMDEAPDDAYHRNRRGDRRAGWDDRMANARRRLCEGGGDAAGGARRADLRA